MSNINPMFNNGTVKSNTPISDSMNRWKNPYYRTPTGNNIGMTNPLEQQQQQQQQFQMLQQQQQQQQPYYNMENNNIPSNFVPQQNTLPPNFMLNPIPNKIKNKKKLKKNVTVLKESTNETVFVNYTVEEKKAAKRKTKIKTKPTLNILESNGATISTDINRSNKNSISLTNDNVSPTRTATMLQNNINNNRRSVYGNNSNSPENNIQSKQIKIKDNVITIDTMPHDENDANMDFSKIINLDRRYTEITPTATRFYMSSSSSTPSSPAIGTPSSAYYANSYKNIQAQRPSSAVMPGFPKYNSYSGVSPYAKRAVSTGNKNSVYKSSKAMGSLSTTTLSTTLENASIDLSMPNTSQNDGVSYLDNFNDIMDENLQEENNNSSFNMIHHGSISEQLADPDITAVSLPNDYIRSYPDSLEIGAIMGIDMDNKKDDLVSNSDISRMVTGSTIASKISADAQSVPKLQSHQQSDPKIQTMNLNENISKELPVEAGNVDSNFDDIDFSNIEAMFPHSHNPSPIKPEQLDDLLNILK
ncbi:hypothetical protein C6P45_003860 [Maudiozyma exigua]|uniref:Uncharacterized protein n=1 Tax=Maudiozyma exigua TaxID=34358 RepID=A0A9P6WBB5_MAUEX|nr:hypothetical protein C6P45_003860 [Kazachstania exigua]